MPPTAAGWRARLAGALCTAALAGPQAAHAARPMVVDDARIVDHKACQVETWYKSTRTSEEIWALPACNPFGPFELTLGIARVPSEVKPVGSNATDAVVQVKALVDPLETNGFGWGFAVGNVRRPSVDPSRNLIGDRYAYGIFTWSNFDDRLLVHVNLGGVQRLQENTRHLTWGVGVEWQAFARALPSLQLLAEVYGETSGRHYVQAGFRWWVVPERWQIDATYGNRVDAWSGSNRWLTVGIRLISPPLLP